jgi:glycosyl transferase family 25
VKIFIISLPDAEARRERAARQLGELGLAFEFFDAMRGEQVLADGYFDRCDEEEWLLNTGHEMSLGEVGCFASHRSMWQKSVDLGEAIMIMEDDFQLLPGFAGAVQQVAQVIQEYGWIRLQTETRARKQRIVASGKYTLWRYTKVPHSTMCYTITPKVAARFIDTTRTIYEPVDVFVKKFWVHGQPIYGLTTSSIAKKCRKASRARRGVSCASVAGRSSASALLAVWGQLAPGEELVPEQIDDDRQDDA